MAGSPPDAVEQTDILYCVNHPKTETLIRCSRCLDPICLKCAVRTPVGLRCPKCAWTGRSPLYVVGPQHYLIAMVVALLASLVAGAIIAQIGLLFTFFVSVPLGGLISEAVVRSVRKRGRTIQVITAVCIALGALAGPWVWRALAAGTLAALPSSPLLYLASLLNVTTLVYVVLASGAAIARLR